MVALPPLVVDAYPTTYRRAPGPWAAPSIAAGERIFARECVVCHGPRAGDLAIDWMARHTAGDLFWWVSRGLPGARMPGFADRLAEESRWDVVDFIRASAAAGALGRLGPEVEPSGGRVLAPDFSVAVGPGVVQSLRDYRGRRVVLLVLFSLPESRPRIDQIARAYASLVAMGAEVIAVPLRPSPDILRRLGASPPVFFPVATDGASEIVSTYELFRPAAARVPHLEFLIDRRGFDSGRLTCSARSSGSTRNRSRPSGRRSTSISLRLWKVVLLADLALALGLGLGYLWWGREAARLGQDLAAERGRPVVGQWTARGVVRAVLPEMQVIVLTHEEIAGVMPAMTMGFPVASPRVYEGIEAGDEVRFTLKGSAAGAVITAIEKIR